MNAAEPAADATTAIDSPPSVFKFLVVVDDTPECRSALRFGARRAARAHGGGLVMLYITHPPDFQHWSTVADVMREEAEAEARSVMFGLATEMQTECGIEPELVIREGKPTEVVLKLLEEDPDIRILVLGTGTGSEGPGPLVSSFSGKLLPSLKIPVTLVPGHLDVEDIDAIT